MAPRVPASLVGCADRQKYIGGGGAVVPGDHRRLLHVGTVECFQLPPERERSRWNRPDVHHRWRWGSGARSLGRLAIGWVAGGGVWISHQPVGVCGAGYLRSALGRGGGLVEWSPLAGHRGAMCGGWAIRLLLSDL